MNNRKSYRLKDTKNITIGPPNEFQHKYHMGFDSKDSSYTGLPPQWKKEFVNVATTGALTKNKQKPAFGNISNSSVSCKRNRVLSKPTDADFNHENISSIDPHKIHLSNPEDLIDSVSFKNEKDNYTVLYGFMSGIDDLLCLKRTSIPASQSVENLTSELRFLTKFSHENIVKFVNAYLWDSFALLVFIDNEDISLNHLIFNFFNSSSQLSNSSIDKSKTMKSRSNSLSDKHFPREFIAYVLIGILNGLKYIHGIDYIHRDIKSDNILITSGGSVKITDFGVCTYTTKYSSGLFGTPYWMAPEVAAGSNYTNSIDIWSLGCVFIEFIDSAPPLYYLEPKTMLEALPSIDIDKIKPVEKLKEVSSLSRPFLECCIAYKPYNRASASVLLTHPFLNNPMKREDVLKIAFQNALM